jgi:hypothetical protein
MDALAEQKQHPLSLRERARERGYLIRRLFNFIPSP